MLGPPEQQPRKKRGQPYGQVELEPHHNMTKDSSAIAQTLAEKITTQTS